MSMLVYVHMQFEFLLQFVLLTIVQSPLQSNIHVTHIAQQDATNCVHVRHIYRKY